MPFRDTAEVRNATRIALRAYMDGPPKKGGVIIANEIQDMDGIGGPIDHETITRFVQGTHHTRRDKVEKIYKYLVYHNRIFDPTITFPTQIDPMGYLLQQFFGVGTNNLVLCKSFVGTYSLYFRSEDLPNHVVLGAITFTENIDMHTFRVTEHQANKRSHSTEIWGGYYFARRNVIVIIMHGERHMDKLPKFYILHQHHYTDDDSGLIAETRGVMFKVGSGGGVFQTKVLIRRDENAYDKCNVIRVRRNVDQDIMMVI